MKATREQDGRDKSSQDFRSFFSGEEVEAQPTQFELTQERVRHGACESEMSYRSFTHTPRVAIGVVGSVVPTCKAQHNKQKT